jgi:hypothetical protein
LIATFGGLLCMLAIPHGTGAVVPPRDCGRMTLKGRTYQVKVDQISCGDGRAFTRAYVNDKVSPKGYKCRDYPAKKGRVKFYCADGRRVFFGIRR